MHTYSEELFSDFHKDTYGFRPRAHEFYDATPERKQEIWDAMGVDFDIEQERERFQKTEDLAAFYREIEMHIAFGAKDRVDALRWMTQGEKFYHQQDVEHWVWNQGILFTDEGRALVKELMGIVKFEEWN
jgi:hypothetical protein